MDEKLQKFLANRGYGSRRQVEQWISDGRVRLNNSVAKIGDRVSINDSIFLDNKKVRSRELVETHIIVYNKPEGLVSTTKDTRGRPLVFDNLPPLKRGKWISVGRLDINTSGLMLFTTNGELANRLMHPKYSIDRKYLVRVYGKVEKKNIEALKKGILIGDEYSRFKNIEYKNEVLKDQVRLNNWFQVTLGSGKNREVRSLWESQGFEVSRLKRISYGPVILPSFVRPGNYSYLSEKEVAQLANLVNLNIALRNDLTLQKKSQRNERRLRSKGSKVKVR
ncbi:MAG: 23S rRNA pseudouridylate synthase B [Porticoccaceae bacterium]|jgi:23S rRNA pseudouridine2605 synthase|nr:23S rRNA pseudouridylate synthase B [Porticoccaceae bacterium]MCH2559739.1 rRNA pseudouridine synthase [Pseudomonadales bacterium]MDP7404202.1 pseudouridine synthase [Porticoccaceae bacterium]MEC7390427.1 pseudouridine synthase [Pseudomonadota bacterium]|tara:strand:+ start:23148 stop:23984 length:837 start_codon:yes stop_codon:yes gene_type:complete